MRSLMMIVMFMLAMLGFVESASAALDVSDAVTALTTDGTAALTAIGGGLLVLAALAVTYKWAKAALFG